MLKLMRRKKVKDAFGRIQKRLKTDFQRLFDCSEKIGRFDFCRAAN
jgi:hypothetical protein